MRDIIEDIAVSCNSWETFIHRSLALREIFILFEWRPQSWSMDDSDNSVNVSIDEMLNDEKHSENVFSAVKNLF